MFCSQWKVTGATPDTGCPELLYDLHFLLSTVYRSNGSRSVRLQLVSIQCRVFDTWYLPPPPLYAFVALYLGTGMCLRLQ